MYCNSNNSCGSHKSIARYYNLSTQPFAADTATPIVTNSTQLVLCGDSIAQLPNGYKIMRAGIYRISADFNLVGTTAGNATIQIYLNESPLAYTARTITLGATDAASVHIETELNFEQMCACNSRVSNQITFVVIGSGTGNITSACTGVIKL